MAIDVEAALGAIGLTIKNLVVGAVASFVALRFWNGLSVWEKWTTFFGGWAIAAWGAAPLTALLELKPAVEILVVLLLGLFGMAVAAEAVQLVRKTDWPGIVKNAVSTITRKPPSDGGEGG